MEVFHGSQPLELSMPRVEMRDNLAGLGLILAVRPLVIPHRAAVTERILVAVVVAVRGLVIVGYTEVLALVVQVVRGLEQSILVARGEIPQRLALFRAGAVAVHRSRMAPIAGRGRGAA